MEDPLLVVQRELRVPKDFTIYREVEQCVEMAVHHDWIKSLVERECVPLCLPHPSLSDPEVQAALLEGTSLGHLWHKLHVQVFSKSSAPAGPLAEHFYAQHQPSCAPAPASSTAAVGSSNASAGAPTGPSPGGLPTSRSKDNCSLSCLLNYVATTNASNLLTEAQRRFSHGELPHLAPSQQQTAPLTSSDALRAACQALCGAPYIDLSNSGATTVQCSGPPEAGAAVHCVVECTNHVLVLAPALHHTLFHAVNFSPGKLPGTAGAGELVLYQLLAICRDLHAHHLPLGDVGLHHLYLDSCYHLSLAPSAPLHALLGTPTQTGGDSPSGREASPSPTRVAGPPSGTEAGPITDEGEVPPPAGGVGGGEGRVEAYLALVKDASARQLLHKVAGSSCVPACTALVRLAQMWVWRRLSNLDYLLCLAYFAGREFGSPRHHPTLPWVLDLGADRPVYRDLTRTKFRLTRGDQQLDHTYHLSSTSDADRQVQPHHITEHFSELSYYVYCARRTPRAVLQRAVRAEWVPRHYPASIARLYLTSPDECIPEFYTSPLVFKSIHPDMDDLEPPPRYEGDVEAFLRDHLSALESDAVTRHLHHWVDLTYGYRLTGAASVRSKNVSLQLVSERSQLCRGGVCQLFVAPHPPATLPRPAPPVMSSAKWRDPDPTPGPSVPSAPGPPHGRGDQSRPTISDDLKPFGGVSSTPKAHHPMTGSTCPPKGGQNPLLAPIVLSKDQNPLWGLQQLETLYNFTLRTGAQLPSVGTTGPVNGPPAAPAEAWEARRARDVVAAGCVAVEVFAAARCRVLAVHAPLEERYALCRGVVASGGPLLPASLRATLRAIFQVDPSAPPHQLQAPPSSLPLAPTPPVGPSGLPPPCPLLLLHPLVDVFPLPPHLPRLHACLASLHRLTTLLMKARALGRHALCEDLAGRRLRAAVWGAREVLPALPAEGLALALPAFLELYSCPVAAVSAAWHLTALLAEALGPEEAKRHLLGPLARLYEEELLTEKFLKLFHRSFLLQLLVRLGMRTFLHHFITPLIEGVGGAKQLAPAGGPHTPQTSSRKHSATLRSVELSPRPSSPVGDEAPHLGAPGISPPDDDPYLPSQQEVSPSPGGRRFRDTPSVGEDPDQDEFVFEDPSDGGTLTAPHTPAGGGLSLRSPPVSDSISLDDVSLQEGEGRVPPSSGGSHSDEETDDERKTFSFPCTARAGDVPHKEEDPDPNTPAPGVPGLESKQCRSFDLSEDEGKFLTLDDYEQDDLGGPCEVARSPHVVVSPPVRIPGASTSSELFSTSLPTLRSSATMYTTSNIVIEDPDNDVLDDTSSHDTRGTSGSAPHDISGRGSHDTSGRGSHDTSGRGSHDTSGRGSHDTSGRATDDVSTSKTADTARQDRAECSVADVCSESVLWLGNRLGPVLTSKYLTRNLLRMLTLCYLPSNGALTQVPSGPEDILSVTRKRIMGDRASSKVLDCLSSLACLYGEKVIMVQYVAHVCDFIGSCRKKLTQTTEAGLLGCAALLQHILPYISDSTFMSCLQETLIKDALYPLIRLFASTRVAFSSGAAVRGPLAHRVVDVIFIMALRVGREMCKKLLMRSIVRLLTAFDRVHVAPPTGSSPRPGPGRGEDGGDPVLPRGGGSGDAEVNTPRTSGPLGDDPDVSRAKALEELKEILTPELAYLSYYPLCRFLGARALENCLPNHELLRSLCIQHDENLQNHHAHSITVGNMDFNLPSAMSEAPNNSSSVTVTNVSGAAVTATNVTGNRIDISDSSLNEVGASQLYPQSIGFMSSVDISSYMSNKMGNSKRHLRGNWLAYWNHEIGRGDHDNTFNFNHIKLQSFVGHTNSIKNLHVLDNENSFMSCSKDKTVRLWSLRSEGDGSAQCSPQFTYTGHKKSVFGITFCERHRVAASCDSAVHIWDPFVGAMVRQLDSLRHSPVTVLASVAPPASELLAATTDATLRVVDLRVRDYAHHYRVSASSAGLVRAVVCSDDGRLVCVAHSSGIVAVLERRTGNLLATWKPHEGEVLCCRWYKNRTFLSSALDQTVAVWTVNESASKFSLKGPTEPVHLLQLYQDQVISATTANRIGHHTAVAADAAYTSYRLRSDSLKGVVTAMEVLPLNRMLLLGSDSGALRLLC